MKRTLTLVLAATALVALLVGTTSTATATPGKTRACSSCHAQRSSVKIAVTKVASTTATVTYRVAVTGGRGQAGWAVLSGGKNLAHRTASTGTFKIAKGRTFKVWGVKKGTGSNYRALTAK